MNRLLITICLSFLLLANASQAADLYFDKDNAEIRTGRFFETGIIIDSGEQSINAVEGKIYFPNNLLEFVNTKENNSIISFWIEKPKLIGNYIKFSGIVPGGYIGQANLFELIFKTKQSGQGNIHAQDLKILLNDGLGTEASINQRAINFNISHDVLASEEAVVIIDLSDQDKPEPFTPMIAKIPEIGGENYLLMFNTQDKGSGIDYYQVKEGYGAFVKVESPYVLKSQKLDKKIIIKAVDKSGNERLVTISPVNPKSWYENFSFFAIIIIVIIVAFSLGRTSWTKTKRKQK
jgi:hypothetical protein